MRNESQHTAGALVMLRHGQTAWSISGQHTGRTDLPLTSVGEEQARAAGERLRAAFPEGFDDWEIYSSTLQRARDTARLAGFERAVALDELLEWDYGRAEGRTREQLRRTRHGKWDLWKDGVRAIDPLLGGVRYDTMPDGTGMRVVNGDGETLLDVTVRARGIANFFAPVIAQGNNVLLVAHAHILRILATQWLGLDPMVARQLRLDTAHYSVLSMYKGDRVIKQWNV